MDTNEKLNPAPEQQVNAENSFITNEVNDVDSVDFSDEEAALASDSEEFNLGDETEVEGEAQVRKNYAELNKTELIAEFRNLLDSHPVEEIRKDVESIKDLFYRIFRQEVEALRAAHKENNPEEPFSQVEDAQEEELKALFVQYRTIRDNHLRKQEDKKEENYKQKLQIIESIKELVSEEEDLNQTFRKFHAIQAQWREIGQVPQSYVKSLWETYNHHVEIFYDYVKINKELRDLDLKRNYEAKEELCKKADALLTSDSIIDAFRQLQKYHEQWREIGPVPYEHRDTIWERFKEITTQINKKHQEYFESRKEEYQANLDAKAALCEKAEAIAEQIVTSPKEWLKQSEELTKLLQLWKEVGFVPKKESNKVYERFKVARDKFFAQRREFYKSFKQEMQDNLNLKKELCEKAEAIMNSDEWKKVTDELIALQREWKKVGAVPRKHSDEMWKRFRLACDTFFNRKGEHFSEIDSVYEENLKAKEALIEEINNFTQGEDNAADFELLKEFQKRWNAIGYVPIKQKETIHKKYQEAIDKQFKLLKVNDNDRKVLKYRSKIENLGGGQNNKADRVLRNEREKLFHKISLLENDITLWENNIGFFAKSKNADTMIAEVHKKIEHAKEEIQVLVEKIKLIDQQSE